MNGKNPTITEAQRLEIKKLCERADVPDKSGELLSAEGAQQLIGDLKRQLAERK